MAQYPKKCCFINEKNDELAIVIDTGCFCRCLFVHISFDFLYYYIFDREILKYGIRHYHNWQRTGRT